MLAITLIRLTFQNVVEDIPHDASAFITYALLALFVAFIITGARKSPDRGSDGPGGEQEQAH